MLGLNLILLDVTLVIHQSSYSGQAQIYFTLPHWVHCQASWTSAWTKGASRGRTRKKATLVANLWEVLPWTGQRVGVGRHGGTRDTGWGFPWWDSRKTMDVKENDSWSWWVWGVCCCALLQDIYRPFPPLPPRLCPCIPLPSTPSPHALLHGDPANRLIFLEQWCQLFIPSLPSLFHLSDCDWLSLPLSL